MKKGDPTSYALGHSEQELERLGTQATLVGPITRRIFERAGIVPGMRVLDFGCGAGHVSTLLAQMVGPGGEIVGVDINPDGLAKAQSRVETLGFRNVSFRQGDASNMTFDGPFDAIAGRYVLQFLPDPAGMLRSLTKHLRKGGIVAFHELSWSGRRSVPPAPLHDQCCRWFVDYIHAAGCKSDMGLEISAVFVAAGLPRPAMNMEALIGAGETAAEVISLLTNLFVSVLPAMEAEGVVTAAEVQVETLYQRVLCEVVAGGCTVIGKSEIGAWTRV
jgi:2-polyprenyl-3-methyl-5-hydroxy-6-metoxy-1,4-benzoquinol methylase